MPQSATSQPIFTTRGNQPLIGIPVQENGETVVYYFNSEEAADKAFPSSKKSVQEVLNLAGSWSDLDFDEMLDELDQIRHQSKPTPIFDSDL